MRDRVTSWMYARMQQGEMKHLVYQHAKDQFPGASVADLVAGYHEAVSRLRQVDVSASVTLRMTSYVLDQLREEMGRTDA